jgi:hypothetical protein
MFRKASMQGFFIYDIGISVGDSLPCFAAHNGGEHTLAFMFGTVSSLTLFSARNYA